MDANNSINDLYSFVSYLHYPTELFNRFSVERAVRESYERSLWVYLCAGKIAQTVTSAKFQVKNLKTDEPLDEHPLLSILRNPNPEMPPKDVWQMVWLHIELTGNSYLLKVKTHARDRMGKQTKELWPLIPDKVKIKPSERAGRLIEYYEYQQGSYWEKYEPEQIIQTKYVNPANFFEGIPPLKPAFRNVDINIEQDKWNHYSLKNRFDPSLLVGFKDTMTPDQIRIQMDLFNKKYSGSENAKKAIAAAGLDKIEKLTATAVEMDFIESKKMVREEICNAFGVPPILVGLAENASLNNVKEYQKIFWEQTLIPKLKTFAETLTWSFRDELGEDNIITFDTSHISSLQKEYSQKVADANGLNYLGVPLEEINRKLELGLDMDAINDGLTDEEAKKELERLKNEKKQQDKKIEKTEKKDTKSE